jgi:hypothetical protein
MLSCMLSHNLFAFRLSLEMSMKPTSPTIALALPADLRARARTLSFLMAGVLVLAAFSLSLQAQAADPAAKQATDPARSYVVAPGDTLDRIIQKTMGQSPLKIELLREALAAANPQAIASVRNPRLKAGAVLQLPDHHALLRAAVQPLLQPADMVSSHPTPNDADNRKRWVRYP